MRPVGRRTVLRLSGRAKSPQKAKGPAPHGHGLLLKLRATLAKHPGSFLVEVGSTREKLPGQGSTVVLAELAARLGLRFLTIDMDPLNTEQARSDMARFPNAQAVTARAEDFLATFEAPVAGAYLDAFDIDHGQHSARRLERYREILGLEITNEESARMHLECARLLSPRVVPGGVIAIDDTWLADGAYAGKGATAVPFLLGEGWKIVAATKTAIALQRPRSAPRD